MPGVQTCALPISSSTDRIELFQLNLKRGGAVTALNPTALDIPGGRGGMPAALQAIPDGDGFLLLRVVDRRIEFFKADADWTTMTRWPATGLQSVGVGIDRFLPLIALIVAIVLFTTLAIVRRR